MNSSYALFLPSTLIISGAGFMILWKSWDIRSSLFWGLSYFAWALSQFLQVFKFRALGIDSASLVQPLFLISIFLQMHGLQDRVGESEVAFRSRLAVCLSTIALTGWLATVPGAGWIILSIRLGMRLTLTVIALISMRRHLRHAVDKILFSIVIAITLAILSVAAGMIVTSYNGPVLTHHSAIVLTGQVIGNTSAIIFALAALGAIIFDVTQRYKDESLHDPLSGLPNRRHFDAHHLAEWQRAALERRYLALMIIDVDMFKAYNDSYGHAAGDRCLVRIAEAIRSCIRRRSDLSARLGGEEFVVVLPGTPASVAAVAAEDICQAVRSAAIPHERSPFGIVTVSIDVAAAVPTGDHNGTLFDAADASLYQAKANGRNRVEVRS